MSWALIPLLASSALAADVDRYRQSASAAAGEGTLQGESPVLGPEGAAGGLLGSFAQDPVVREGAGDAVTPAVSALLPVEVYGAWTVEDTVRVDVFVPVYAHVEAPVNEFGGAALGDLRLQVAAPVYDSHTFSLAFLPRLELPTGNARALTRGGFSGGGAMLLGGGTRDGTVGWVANLGLTASAAEQLGGVALGSTVDGVVGGFWRPDGGFRVGAEADLRAGLAQGPSGGNTTSAVHLFAQQVLPSGWGLLLGAGTGLISGVGSPDYRVVAGLHFGAGIQDADGDGVLADDDRCPELPEDRDDFEDFDGCPDPDNDRDGVVDADDQCADGAEDLDGWEDDDGCPDPDNDGDGVADVDDGCPDAGGPFDGCPDSDEDGLADHVDSCPLEARPPEERLELSDGCPKGVYLTDFTIAHDLPILFVDRGDTLDPGTVHVLDAILGMFLSHPEIAEVEVQVHIDDSGNEGADFALTDRRADAVVAYLVERGVDAGRLVPRGIGPTDPVDTNRTATGRARNRRVVFHIAKVDRALMPDRTPPAEPDLAMGTLAVTVAGGAQATVWVDGTRIERKAPFVDLPIPAGPHEVKVVNQSQGIDLVRRVRVAAGEQARVVIDGSPEPEPEVEVPDDSPGPRSVIDVRRGSEDEDDDSKRKRPPRSSKKR